PDRAAASDAARAPEPVQAAAPAWASVWASQRTSLAQLASLLHRFASTARLRLILGGLDRFPAIRAVIGGFLGGFFGSHDGSPYQVHLPDVLSQNPPALVR